MVLWDVACRYVVTCRNVVTGTAHEFAVATAAGAICRFDTRAGEAPVTVMSNGAAVTHRREARSEARSAGVDA
jgi:hypothetical protein